MDTETDALLKERMALLERQLHEINQTSGMPTVGGLARRVITNSKPLWVFQELLEVVARAEYEVGRGESVSGCDKEELSFIPRARWITSRQWKGSWWMVEIQQDRETGRINKEVYPLQPQWRRRLDMLLNTGGERCAYNFAEAELKAQARLLSTLSEAQQSAYILNGGFMEIARSGLWYLLRKGRPTIAIRMHEDEWSWWMDILCALCLHPLGYYEHTWAGVMVPSDEVLTHLLHIRADEHYFWRKANQIPLDAMESGV